MDELLRMVEQSKDELIDLHRGLVRIPTVNTGRMPTGGETEACKYLKGWLAKEEIDGEIIESAPGRGNFIARLKGEAGSPRLLYMSHTDVVPAEDEAKWEFPPFSAHIKDGRVYGRGSSDNKSLVACEAMALAILKRSRVKLKGDLIFAAGADEEAGGRYGFGWLAANVPDKIKAHYAINEGGGSLIRTKKGPLYLFNVGEKGRLEVKIALKGKASHAATPWRSDNALFKLSEAIDRIHRYEPEKDASIEIFRHVGPLFDIEEKIGAENIERILEKISRQNETLGSILRGLSRMTLTPTMASSGVKSNSVPGSATLTCDVRTLPHQDEAYVRREVEKTLLGMDADVEIDYTARPNASPYETDFASKVKEATYKAIGRRDVMWLPSLVIGFTDSRLVRPLGNIVYNFSPGNPDSESAKERIHDEDESTDIKGLVIRTNMLVTLACDVLG